MKVTKFEGLGRGLIKVWFDDKSILISGELTMTPKFYADIFSIKNWEYPFDKEEITDKKRIEIINAIEDFSKKGKIPVVFEQ